MFKRKEKNGKKKMKAEESFQLETLFGRETSKAMSSEFGRNRKVQIAKQEIHSWLAVKKP